VHDVVILIIKGIAGGSLVVAFALLSEGFRRNDSRACSARRPRSRSPA
jgi:hypothetical protein